MFADEEVGLSDRLGAVAVAQAAQQGGPPDTSDRIELVPSGLRRRIALAALNAARASVVRPCCASMWAR